MAKTKAPKVLNFARKVLFKVTYEFSKAYSEQILQISYWIHPLSLYYAHDCLKNEEKIEKGGWSICKCFNIFLARGVKKIRAPFLACPARSGRTSQVAMNPKS